MTYIIIRLHSLGNVAMSIPVLYPIVRTHLDDRFIILTEKDISGFFYNTHNVLVHRIDTGLVWWQTMLHMIRVILSYSPDVIIDLQNSLVTFFIRVFFCFHFVRSFAIRRTYLRRFLLCLLGHTRSKPIMSEFDRYAQVFRRGKLLFGESFSDLPVNISALETVKLYFGEKIGHWIGVAPFAKYHSNQLPNKIVKDIISKLCKDDSIRVFLFGGGKVEGEILREWAFLFPRVVNVANVVSLECELELMRMMDVMVCMDSANQHLARLVGTRVLTIWCATHPYGGFTCWNQPFSDWIAVSDLSCRPCAINGTNRCKFKNYSCKKIESGYILNKIYSSLNL